MSDNSKWDYIVTDTSEVTSTDFLTENNNKILGKQSKNDTNSKDTSKPRSNIGIPCTFLDSNNEELYVIPEIIHTLFNIEYGMLIDYNKDDKKIFYTGEYQTNLKISNVAKTMLKKELTSKRNKNNLFFVSEYYRINGHKIGPAVTLDKTSYFDISYFGADLLFAKDYIYIDFPDDSAKRTVNFAKVFEHDFLGHNVKAIHNNNQENVQYSKYQGSYKPGKVEEFVNTIRVENELEKHLALNYEQRKDGKQIKYFGTKEDLGKINSELDIESLTTAKLESE